MPTDEYPVVFAAEYLNNQLEKSGLLKNLEFDYEVSGNEHSVHLIDTDNGQRICLYTDAVGFLYVEDADGTGQEIVDECVKALQTYTRHLNVAVAVTDM